MRSFLLLTLLCMSPLQASEWKIVKELRFSEADSALSLDLYVPQVVEPAVPCVIVIQGGGFAPQDGKRFQFVAERLASAGFAAALISYRGRPEHKYQDTLADIQAALSYVRKTGTQYGIDPKRIGATGRSAGGTLAALLAVTGKGADRIQAGVCFAGVFDFISRFTSEPQLALQPNHEAKLKSNGEWIGSNFSVDDPDWKAASAIYQLDSADPPLLFLHSRDDRTVPWLQSRDMDRAMKELGIASELKIYETGGHAVQPEGEDSLGEMVQFFQKHLRAPEVVSP